VIINTELFAEKIAQMSSRPQANHAAIACIQKWILEFAEQLNCQRIEPAAVAEYGNIPLEILVPEFLYGVRLGTFDLHWDIHCPHCKGTTNSYIDLSMASRTSFCEMCKIDYKGDFSDHVSITFSLSQAIDEREFVASCPITHTETSLVNLFANQAQSDEGEFTITESGTYYYYCPLTDSVGELTVTEEETEVLQKVQISQQTEHQFSPNKLVLKKGQVKLLFTNHAYPLAGIHLEKAEHMPEVISPPTPRLSGLHLIHYPEFKKLFGQQVLSEREQLSISTVTTVFTDITGSTQLYEELGDIQAYNAVRDHFDILFNTIQENGGFILKTIGDAVMASFKNNEDALNALLAAIRAFKAYNTDSAPKPIYIKSGIHCGSAILVNLNNQLDYFGSTINKAARIQNVAEANEICLSEQVYEDKQIKEVLSQQCVTTLPTKQVNLKGIAGEQNVYTLRIAECHL